ncbi:FMR1-interacting protein NUFIP2-like [Latimeria chalumnae]|uniref:Nuclear FMR1 interacting protein 2 n=1 Tax=Latimeria chalumnae TaxID=7897 RepID=H3AY67_LATCH|nr:PREDICTED: nuclear fragile X mental retardation-interacting protein 2 isoform X2 [Latimeria chalumnae]|eukprot:XP_014344453.1 PREDICTED: nuclear fragile X mental retardation-interacting protein 2 isoform X2 [Latimeria chalumnae]
MEEQQAGRHRYHYHHHHGAETSSPKPPQQQHGNPLKHDYKHPLQQHQETHKKKTGYGELNGNAEDRRVGSIKSLDLNDLNNPVPSRVTNGNQQLVDTNSNLKQAEKASAFNKVASNKKNFNQNMDKKNDKTFESKALDKEALLLPNGVVTNNSGYITNGYLGKAADNDGSGSESGYTTPKKRKARHNSIKSSENLNLFQDKTIQQEMSSPVLKPELDISKPESGDPKGVRLENAKPVIKYEVSGAGRGKIGSGDIQRKNSDVKPAVSKKFEDKSKGKATAAVASKDDSWTLFKPPPVFPVDNSSAKIVPKISYASKVKENLNKSAQNLSSLSSMGETPAQAQSSGRLSQVPMSAMKSVMSPSFSNGPVLGGTDGNICPPGVQPIFTTAANIVSPTSSGSETVMSLDGGPPLVTAEQKKCSLFVYPSNTQSVLPGTTQVELLSQTNQQNLGDIFQNQWGLSFINEPSAGPEPAAGNSTDNKIMEVTFQGECAATLVSQGAEILPSGTERPVFPKAYELDKRTSPQVLSGILKPVPITASEGGAMSTALHQSIELQKDGGVQGAIVFVSKDCGIETPQALPTNSLFSSVKEQKYQRDLERKDSLSSFDIRAAVTYHTKEMEFVWNLQKQDPKKVVTYEEAMDRPDQ